MLATCVPQIWIHYHGLLVESNKKQRFDTTDRKSSSGELNIRKI